MIYTKNTINCIFIYIQDEIPDLETVYEDISITNEFKIDDSSKEFSEALNESKLQNYKINVFCLDYLIIFTDFVEHVESCKNMQVEQGEEAKEEDMDVISLSSSTLSDFDIITEEEINLLK